MKWYIYPTCITKLSTQCENFESSASVNQAQLGFGADLPMYGIVDQKCLQRCGNPFAKEQMAVLTTQKGARKSYKKKSLHDSRRSF